MKMGKTYKQVIYRKENPKANQLFEILRYVIIRKMQMETRMRCHFVTETGKNKYMDIDKCW